MMETDIAVEHVKALARRFNSRVPAFGSREIADMVEDGRDNGETRWVRVEDVQSRVFQGLTGLTIATSGWSSEPT